MKMRGFKAPTAADESVLSTSFSSEWFRITLDANTGERARPKVPKANTRLFSGTQCFQIRPPRSLKARYDIRT
ncbi:MAG: hypothetical protein KFF50_17015, partial [Desulfatitalea sp.]|nr:hypothetical protein [Desulfatitalea sp.]